MLVGHCGIAMPAQTALWRRMLGSNPGRRPCVMDRPPAAPAAAEHRTVSRAVAIMEMVASCEPDGVRLGELAAPIGAPKSSIHGIAKGLVAVGYLREQDGRYFTGPGALNLLARRLPAFPAAYHAALRTLVDTWEETAFLASLVGDSSVYVDRVESPKVVRAAPPMNSRIPLWPRSTGKCFLAWMPERQSDAILRRTVPDLSKMDGIKLALAEVRKSGFALNDAETEPDMIGIASPILSRRGSPVALAIAIGGPASRMAPHFEAMIANVRETAESLAAWT
jgi:DNA-binding IclR family transcriptional regulator